MYQSFTSRRKALKIRRPLTVVGVRFPLRAPITGISCGRSSFGKWQIFCEIRGLESVGLKSSIEERNFRFARNPGEIKKMKSTD
jgi:hypothetical protein